MSFALEASPSFSALEGHSGSQSVRKLGAGLLANALLVALVFWVKVPSSDRGMVAPRVQIISLSRLPKLALLPEALKPIAVPVRRPALKARLVDTPKPSIARTLELPAPPIITPSKIEVRPVLPIIETPSMPAPKPVVGTFASTPPTRALAERAAVRVSTGGFSSSAIGSEVKPSPTLVVSGKFGGEEPRTASKPGAGTGLAEHSGFEDSYAVRKTKVKMEVAGSDASSFDARPSSSRRNRVEREATSETEFKGVEILSKPRPQYTAEARQLGIEGEVHLRILFGADGRLKVLSVVRGLGHGLDENATLAAAQIQFRPASKLGQAVEQAAVVRVQFQLAN